MKMNPFAMLGLWRVMMQPGTRTDPPRGDAGGPEPTGYCCGTTPCASSALGAPDREASPGVVGN